MSRWWDLAVAPVIVILAPLFAVYLILCAVLRSLRGPKA